MTRIDLRAMVDAKGDVLTAGHPIRKLLDELPWLHGLASVRMFFQALMIQYRDRLARVNEPGWPQALEDEEAWQAMMFFNNVMDPEIVVEDHIVVPRDLYRRSVADIAAQAERIGASRSGERWVRRFKGTVALLMHAIRYHGPRYKRAT